MVPGCRISNPPHSPGFRIDVQVTRLSNIHANVTWCPSRTLPRASPFHRQLRHGASLPQVEKRHDSSDLSEVLILVPHCRHFWQQSERLHSERSVCHRQQSFSGVFTAYKHRYQCQTLQTGNAVMYTYTSEKHSNPLVIQQSVPEAVLESSVRNRVTLTRLLPGVRTSPEHLQRQETHRTAGLGLREVSGT